MWLKYMSPEYNQSFPWYSHTAAYERAREEHDVFVIEKAQPVMSGMGALDNPDVWPDQAHYETYKRLLKAMDDAMFQAMFSTNEKRPPCIDVFSEEEE